MAERVQLSRKKGWRMPPNTIKVCRPSPWGNPYRLSAYRFAHADGSPAPHDEKAARAMAVRDYEMWLEVSLPGQQLKELARTELSGVNLACWCPLDQPCHADVLLRIANS